MYVSQYLKIATYVPFCDAAPHINNVFRIIYNYIYIILQLLLIIIISIIYQLYNLT